MVEINYENTIICKLISGKKISESELKRIYRQLCKDTHPDLKRKDSSEFLHLQMEYEQAKESLFKIKECFKVQDGNNSNISAEDLRSKLYNSLSHYTASGLHSVRVRIKPELKERNTSILQEVLYWSKLYDPAFIKIFLEYNKIHFQRFNDWRFEKKFISGRRLFLNGLRCFFDYERNRKISILRSANSYIKDSICILEFSNPNPLTISILEFAHWLFKELESFNV